MKTWRSIISLLLVLVFALELLPLSSFAVESNDPAAAEAVDTSEPVEQAAEDTVAADEPIVIGEVEEFREEAAKHFRMSDGSFSMVQYSEPVHWKDASGAWQDIDNTLTLQDGRYVSENGAVKKSFASSMADGELFRISYGTYSVGMTYAVSADSKAPAQTDESAVDPEQPDTDPQAETAEPVSKETPVSGTAYTARQDARVKASVENTARKVLTDLPLSECLAQEIAPSKVQYADADQNIDLLYENHGYNIKESIQIHERQESYSYTFLLDLQNLSPKLMDDGSILLQSKDEKSVFSIPAPLLEDAKGVISDAAKYTVSEENGCWLLTVEADAKWMNDDSRAYPVQLDPSIHLSYGSNVIFTTYVRSSMPSATGTNQEMYCGYNNAYGNCRVALQITQLPAIPSDCVPISVEIELYHAAYYKSSSIGSSPPSTPMLIEAHELTNGVTDISTQTWNTLAPKVDSKVIDYQKATGQTVGQRLKWDISSVGLKWYENGSTNNGLIFIAPNAQSLQQTANLSGNHFISYGPILTVFYRSAVGLENYYSYQETSVGRAGDVYISDFTNQMTVTHTDLTFPSEATPFTLSHVYNSERANQQFSSTQGINTCNYTSMVLGAGWKLSAQQTVVPKTIGEQSYLIYNDKDGTDHYFRNTATNTYEDEDGLNLKIVKSGVTYTMTDEDANNTWTFYNGYLISHKDLVGNMIYYAYNSNYNAANTSWKPTNGNSNKLVQIVSVPVNQSPTTICTFGYTGWFLTSMTDYANRTTSFSIQGENNRNILKYIQYPDESQSRYEYNSDSGRMRLIYDTDAKYGLEITSRICQGVKTVDQLKEFYAPSFSGTRTYGNAFHAYRNSANLTSYRFYGADHTPFDTTNRDDIVLYNVLDNRGRTICSYETDTDKAVMLGVSAGEYTENNGTSKKNNRLISASALGLQVENILNNCGVESNGADFGWTPVGVSSNIAIAQHTSENGPSHTGKRSLMCSLLDAASATQEVRYTQDVSLEAGLTYIFSGYIRTDFWSYASDGTQGAYLEISSSSAQQPSVKSDMVSYSTYKPQENDGIDTFDGGWEKVSVTYTPPTDGNYHLSFVLHGAKGTAYADDFQLERHAADSIRNETFGASSTNLLNFGSFDGTSLACWTGSGFQSAASNFLLGTHAAQTTGNTGAQRRLSQNIPINRSAAGLTFVLSGWGKADSVASAVTEPTSTQSPYFGLVATIHYQGNSTEDHYVSFSSDYSGWQYASGNIVPKQPAKTIDYITVSCAYDYNANTAMFDNISFVREPLQTFSYDNEGKLYSATDGNANESVTYFSGTHRPSSYTNSAGITHTLTYTDKKLLATDTVADLTTTNEYNNNTGSLETQTIKSSQNAAYLRSSSTYTTNGHFRTSSTDANGIKSTCGYTSTRLLEWSKTENDPEQHYTYNYYNDRMENTYITYKAAIVYSYANSALTQLRRKAYLPEPNQTTAIYQLYNITNDNFGNTTAVSVSGSDDGANFSSPITLISKTYEPGVNNGRLQTETYSNGDAVTYSYDLFDRIAEESYTGTVTGTHRYVYDGAGNIAEKTATTGSQPERYTYQYDSLGRLYHSRAYHNGVQTLSTSYNYDTANRLKKQSWLASNGCSVAQDYAYNTTDGTLSSLFVAATIPGGEQTVANPTEAFAYNDLRQVTRKTVSFGNSSLFYRAFTYRMLDGDRSSNQVEFMKYCEPDADNTLILGYKYGYDANGRINSVMPSSRVEGAIEDQVVTYEYDSMGQLKKCVDKSSGSAVTYEYKYDTAGNLRKADKGSTSIAYAYQNPTWKDLLTSVTIEGTTKAISYPTNDGAVTAGTPLTWYNGNDYTFTWKQGTQLATMQKGSTTTTYSYDMEGVRNAKAVGNTTYHFDTLSGKVVHQTGAARELWFVYDENGQPYMLITRSGGTVKEYFYLLNLQGDVVGIINSDKELVATYRYDPYGSIVSEWEEPTDTVGEINPLRYRGYFYDFESGFYYLQSRYYDPAIGRFISADSFATTDANGFLSCNMFAYCENDPVNRSDPAGEFGIGAFIARAVVGGLINVCTSYISAKAVGLEYDWEDAGVAFLSGAFSYSGWGWASALLNGASTYNMLTKNGVSKKDAIRYGIASSALSFASVGNLATIADKSLLQSAGGVAATAAVDTVFGTGTGLSNSALQRSAIQTTGKRSISSVTRGQRTGYNSSGNGKIIYKGVGMRRLLV